jgi:hypothetical protein|tara:strand:- start:3018 stop:3164 length:147 start_codon:yes stop_codon:yes gene_type:complete
MRKQLQKMILSDHLYYEEIDYLFSDSDPSITAPEKVCNTAIYRLSILG